ncbi:MAG: HAD-IIA family hydrolase [Armatimonadetes bacterium]|nr:HAD-IIA family hydrolase [Armatimonadota bacterium]
MSRKSYLLDMDGVLVRGNTAIPGAQQFIEGLIAKEVRFAILTNNPLYTPRDLQHRLAHMGLSVPADHLFTSAMATAQFLHSQMPGGTAYVIGEAGLTTALHDVGFVQTERNPDYMVLGESTNLNYEQISKAVQLVANGARFIATNPDPSGPNENGIGPACGALAALIESATGVKPYFIGKPNPLMMRAALRFVGAHSEETVMVGDRMDTDMVAGIESGLETILVLTGVTAESMVPLFPYRPMHIVASVADIDVG